jgi:hypothetical protein
MAFFLTLDATPAYKTKRASHTCASLFLRFVQAPFSLILIEHSRWLAGRIVSVAGDVVVLPFRFF